MLYLLLIAILHVSLPLVESIDFLNWDLEEVSFPILENCPSGQRVFPGANCKNLQSYGNFCRYNDTLGVCYRLTHPEFMFKNIQIMARKVDNKTMIVEKSPHQDYWDVLGSIYTILTDFPMRFNLSYPLFGEMGRALPPTRSASQIEFNANVIDYLIQSVKLEEIVSEALVRYCMDERILTNTDNYRYAVTKISGIIGRGQFRQIELYLFGKVFKYLNYKQIVMKNNFGYQENTLEAYDSLFTAETVETLVTDDLTKSIDCNIMDTAGNSKIRIKQTVTAHNVKNLYYDEKMFTLLPRIHDAFRDFKNSFNSSLDTDTLTTELGCEKNIDCIEEPSSMEDLTYPFTYKSFLTDIVSELFQIEGKEELIFHTENSGENKVKINGKSTFWFALNFEYRSDYKMDDDTSGRYNVTFMNHFLDISLKGYYKKESRQFELVFTSKDMTYPNFILEGTIEKNGRVELKCRSKVHHQSYLTFDIIPGNDLVYKLTRHGFKTMEELLNIKIRQLGSRIEVIPFVYNTADLNEIFETLKREINLIYTAITKKDKYLAIRKNLFGNIPPFIYCTPPWMTKSSNFSIIPRDLFNRQRANDVLPHLNSKRIKSLLTTLLKLYHEKTKLFFTYLPYSAPNYGFWEMAMGISRIFENLWAIENKPENYDHVLSSYLDLLDHKVAKAEAQILRGQGKSKYSYCRPSSVFKDIHCRKYNPPTRRTKSSSDRGVSPKKVRISSRKKFRTEEELIAEAESFKFTRIAEGTVE